MLRKCHGLDVELDIYQRNDSNFILCYIRKQELVLKPEEEVRQAILKVLYEHLTVDRDSYICRVEFQSLDISFYHNYAKEGFQPSLNPFLIIETKSDDCIPVLKSQFVSQLLQYLERHYCSHGLLLNCREIYHFDRVNDFSPYKIGLNEILKIFKNAKPEVEADILDFENAKNGDIESFKRLSLKFGNNSKLTFECKEYSAPIKAFLFDFQQDYIFFYLSGTRAGRQRPKIKFDSFVRLISITE